MWVKLILMSSILHCETTGETLEESLQRHGTLGQKKKKCQQNKFSKTISGKNKRSKIVFYDLKGYPFKRNGKKLVLNVI